MLGDVRRRREASDADYFERGPREYTWNRWSGAFTTTANHAPLEDWFGWIVDAGFQVRAVREPRPEPSAVEAWPRLAAAMRVPYFLMLDLAAGPANGEGS